MCTQNPNGCQWRLFRAFFILRESVGHTKKRFFLGCSRVCSFGYYLRIWLKKGFSKSVCLRSPISWSQQETPNSFKLQHFKYFRRSLFLQELRVGMCGEEGRDGWLIRRQETRAVFEQGQQHGLLRIAGSIIGFRIPSTIRRYETTEDPPQ